jgi:Uma2 family endonuclease
MNFAAHTAIMLNVVMTAPNPLFEYQHLVLDYVSWDFYERLLQEIGNRPIRVTFHRGRIEIMAPLAEHELEKRAIGRLLEQLTLEFKIPIRCFGSTTFRREDKQAGLEPDECYYLRNDPKVRGMMRFDPAVHPVPDLAVEIDVTHRSISRQPIYADLGVPELWRYDGRRLNVLLLNAAGDYSPSPSSPNFPLLPMETFQTFVKRMLGEEEQNSVVNEFRQWVHGLQP